MIKINSKTKVYIISPYHNTGGPKSLHQLANVLVEKGIDTYLVYYHDGKFTGQQVPLYDFCKAKVTQKIVDHKENIIVVPEIYPDLLGNYFNLKKVIWWLSLDFYFTTSLWESVKKSTYRKGLPLFLSPVMFVKYLINDPTCLKNLKKLDNSKFKDYYHLYNCEYERLFLKKQNVGSERMAYLCGPLENTFFKVDFNYIKPYKKDIVAYNPAKMNPDFLKKVKSKLSILNNNIEFVAIKNMSREQVYNTLKSAKVYIDFGFFPGPERMPREAVALYCNIITSTEGSAGNDIDIMIPKEFKFNIREKKSVNLVSNLINKMIVNYFDYVKYGNQYRQKVWNQITDFSKEISEIFEVDNEA